MADWSNAEIEQARKYFAEGMNCSTIARQLGRSRSAVIGELSRVGLSARTRRLGGVAERILVVNAKRKKAAAIARPSPGAFEFDRARYEGKPAPGFSGKPFLDLAANECRYPVDPAAADPQVLFCAAPTRGVGMSWCPYHFAICYRPALPRRPAWLLHRRPRVA
jgi:hypothetical protein